MKTKFFRNTTCLERFISFTLIVFGLSYLLAKAEKGFVEVNNLFPHGLWLNNIVLVLTITATLAGLYTIILGWDKLVKNLSSKNMYKFLLCSVGLLLSIFLYLSTINGEIPDQKISVLFWIVGIWGGIFSYHMALASILDAVDNL